MVSTSIKLPDELKARIHKLAELTHRSPHSVMVEALERGISREERVYEFVQEAVRSDTAVERGGNIYRTEEVHTWLKRLAEGETAGRPQPWRR